MILALYLSFSCLCFSHIFIDVRWLWLVFDIGWIVFYWIAQYKYENLKERIERLEKGGEDNA